MDLINKIDIQVTQAVITSIAFHFNPEKQEAPHLSIAVDLLTASKKRISSVTFETREYYGSKIEREFIPLAVDVHLAEIVHHLAPVVTRRINQIEQQIEASVL